MLFRKARNRAGVLQRSPIYHAPEPTLRDKMSDATPMAKGRPATQVLEKTAIGECILDLDARGFPPSLEDVRVMADCILASRGKRRVSTQWHYRFVQRREELRTRYPRTYDCQRAICEDRDLLSGCPPCFSTRAGSLASSTAIYTISSTRGVICSSMSRHTILSAWKRQNRIVWQAGMGGRDCLQSGDSF